MVYFDYSATTFPSKKVIKSFSLACQNYVGNPNSSYRIGKIAKAKIDNVTLSIAKILDVKKEEIIYTSGSSEANNLAIKGVCKANSGKHIITTYLEHSSVMAPINRLIDEGYEVSFLKLDENGLVDMNHLASIIREDTVLVSIIGVDSELGIKQNINDIGVFLNNYPNCHFHVDATQMIGKTYFDFSNVDLVSFSAHKFFGIKGIGCLIKKENVKIMPLIDGGLSTTKYRSGTPALELISSLEVALKDAYINFDKKLSYINKLNNELRIFFEKFNGIKINNTENSIDQIINISLLNAKDIIYHLNNSGIYVSSKSACSLQDMPSKSIMNLYNDEQRALNSIRISISYKTTKKDILTFKREFTKIYVGVLGYENTKV